MIAMETALHIGIIILILLIKIWNRMNCDIYYKLQVIKLFIP